MKCGAVSGQAACDLVTEIDGKLYKVEVRSVGRNGEGRPNSPGGHALLSRKGHQILAVVDRTTGTIRYYVEDGSLHIDLVDSLPFPELDHTQMLMLHLEKVRQCIKDNAPQTIPLEERATARDQARDLLLRLEA